MASLKWQDSSGQSAAHSNDSSGGNPWFVASIGLMGVILGYGLGNFTGGGFGIAAGNPSPQQVAQAPAPAAPAAPQAPATPATADDDPFLGDKDAPVTLIEFTDYQCPFCGRHFTNTYGQLKKDYIDTGKVKYVVRDFPLGFHPHAQKTAEATECADDQGKFWEMHDKIFQTQATWSSSTDIIPTLKQYAADLKLNTNTFDSCLDNGTHKDEVQKDMADGSASGVNGTPGFWVLGPGGKTQQISGAMPFANFKTAIDTLLGSDAAAAQVPSSGTRTIKMTAELWKFTPNVVTVKQGEKVALEVTGVSGTHGLAIPELGINETVIQGQTVDINIPTDKTGTFDFRCSIQCGSGHNDMTGQIIVKN